MNFLVELYLPSGGPDGIDEIDARARAAAQALAADGPAVRHLRSTLVPGDEMCLLLYEAPTAELALEAARRAGVTGERVVEAIERVG